MSNYDPRLAAIPSWSADKPAGPEKLIFVQRDRKLEEARKRRAQA